MAPLAVQQAGVHFFDSPIPTTLHFLDCTPNRRIPEGRRAVLHITSGCISWPLFFSAEYACSPLALWNSHPADAECGICTLCSARERFLITPCWQGFGSCVCWNCGRGLSAAVCPTWPGDIVPKGNFGWPYTPSFWRMWSRSQKRKQEPSTSVAPLSAVTRSRSQCWLRCQAVARDLNSDLVLSANVFCIVAATGYVYGDFARGFLSNNAAFSNALFILIGAIYLVDAWAYLFAWQGNAGSPGFLGASGDIFNIAASTCYACTSYIYPFETSETLIRCVIFIEGLGNVFFFLSALGYLYYFLTTDKETRGCKLNNVELWANLFNLLPSIVYVFASMGTILFHFARAHKIHHDDASSSVGGSGDSDAWVSAVLSLLPDVSPAAHLLGDDHSPSSVNTSAELRMMSKLSVVADIGYVLGAVFYLITWYRDVREAYAECAAQEAALWMAEEAALQASCGAFDGAALERGRQPQQQQQLLERGYSFAAFAPAGVLTDKEAATGGGGMVPSAAPGRPASHAFHLMAALERSLHQLQSAAAAGDLPLASSAELESERDIFAQLLPDGAAAAAAVRASMPKAESGLATPLLEPSGSNSLTPLRPAMEGASKPRRISKEFSRELSEAFTSAAQETLAAAAQRTSGDFDASSAAHVGTSTTRHDGAGIAVIPLRRSLDGTQTRERAASGTLGAAPAGPTERPALAGRAASAMLPHVRAASALLPILSRDPALRRHSVSTSLPVLPPMAQGALTAIGGAASHEAMAHARAQSVRIAVAAPREHVNRVHTRSTIIARSRNRFVQVFTRSLTGLGLVPPDPRQPSGAGSKTGLRLPPPASSQPHVPLGVAAAATTIPDATPTDSASTLTGASSTAGSACGSRLPGTAASEGQLPLALTSSSGSGFAGARPPLAPARQTSRSLPVRSDGSQAALRAPHPVARPNALSTLGEEDEACASTSGKASGSHPASPSPILAAALQGTVEESTLPGHTESTRAAVRATTVTFATTVAPDESAGLLRRDGSLRRVTSEYPQADSDAEGAAGAPGGASFFGSGFDEEGRAVGYLGYFLSLDDPHEGFQVFGCLYPLFARLCPAYWRFFMWQPPPRDPDTALSSGASTPHLPTHFESGEGESEGDAASARSRATGPHSRAVSTPASASATSTPSASRRPLPLVATVLPEPARSVAIPTSGTAHVLSRAASIASSGGSPMTPHSAAGSYGRGGGGTGSAAGSIAGPVGGSAPQSPNGGGGGLTRSPSMRPRPKEGTVSVARPFGWVPPPVPSSSVLSRVDLASLSRSNLPPGGSFTSTPTLGRSPSTKDDVGGPGSTSSLPGSDIPPPQRYAASAARAASSTAVAGFRVPSGSPPPATSLALHIVDPPQRTRRQAEGQPFATDSLRAMLSQLTPPRIRAPSAQSAASSAVSSGSYLPPTLPDARGVELRPLSSLATSPPLAFPASPR